MLRFRSRGHSPRFHRDFKKDFSSLNDVYNDVYAADVAGTALAFL